MLECQQARKTMAGKTLLPSYDGKQNKGIDGREKYGGHGDESFSYSRKRSYVKEEDSMSDHPSKYHRESYQRPYNKIEYSRKLEGPVVLVRNLDESIYLSEKATFLVFNIFSIYGNILRIKMLKTKPGMAMVEMETMEGVMKVMENLLGVQIRGKELQMKKSKQDCVNGSMNNDTNQKSSFWDFTGSTYNRFSSPLNPSLPIKVRRTHAPSKIIQFWNVVSFDNDEETERKIRENMEKENVATPITIKFLKETKSPRNERLLLSGLMEFNSQVEGIEAMVFCNNLRIIPNQLQENEDKAGYSLKLSFSSLQVEIPGHLVRRSVSKDDADKSS
jgi:heterogeneous nuclear ribonucleoprotein L